MKKLIIIAQASLTDNQARKILEVGELVWDINNPIASLKFSGIEEYIDIKFVHASIKDEIQF